jgi:hypothetical protein
MNLYFLSLLKSTLERKKNLALSYQVEETSIISVKFPFIQQGDIIRCNTGTDIVQRDGRILHPLFYRYIEGSHSTTLSSRDKKRLKEHKYSECEFQTNWAWASEACFIFSKFRISKMKFDLYLFPSDDDGNDENEKCFQTIKDDLKKGGNCSVFSFEPESRILYVTFD